jgi:hypothetical protein
MDVGEQRHEKEFTPCFSVEESLVLLVEQMSLSFMPDLKDVLTPALAKVLLSWWVMWGT